MILVPFRDIVAELRSLDGGRWGRRWEKTCVCNFRYLKALNSLNLVLGTKLVQNSDLVFSPRSKFSLKGVNLQD